MSDTNRETLRSYEATVALYADASASAVNVGTQAWMDGALRDLPAEARILEIGSAHGRDAAYIASCGFRVECTDAVPGFVARLAERGFEARLFNVLTDTLVDRYDLILANAVLPHFSPDECAHVLERMLGALRPSGRFAFSLKCGSGEEWSREKIGQPRYFRYWECAEVEEMLTRAGVGAWEIEERRTDRAHARWAYVIAYANG